MANGWILSSGAVPSRWSATNVATPSSFAVVVVPFPKKLHQLKGGVREGTVLHQNDVFRSSLQIHLPN